jgi:hypothetical protein
MACIGALLSSITKRKVEALFHRFSAISKSVPSSAEARLSTCPIVKYPVRIALQETPSTAILSRQDDEVLNDLDLSLGAPPPGGPSSSCGAASSARKGFAKGSI